MPGIFGHVGANILGPRLTTNGTYLGPIGNNTIFPTSLCVTGQAEQSQIITLRNPLGTTDIQIASPGAYVNAASTYLDETVMPASYTMDAAYIGYPVATPTWYQIKKGGANSWTVPAWSGNKATDGNTYSDLTPLGITIPDGANVVLYTHVTGANLPQFAPGNMRTLYTDEGCNRAAGSTTAPKTVTDNSTGLSFRICSVVGIFGTRMGDSVAIVGDSQQAFASASYLVNTGAPADHNRGDVASTIGGTYAYVNVAVGGDQWTTLLYNSINRLSLALKATIIIDQLGINEYNNKQRTTEVYPLAEKRRGLRLFSGKKVICTEVTPRTTGVWTAVDGSDQVLAAYSANLPTYNAGLTYSGLLPAPLARYANVQNATTVNKWLADGTAAKYAIDGLHLSDYAAHTYSKAQLATAWLAQLAALTPVTIPDAPVDFAATGTPSYASGYATNGIFTRNDVLPGRPVWSFIFNVKLGASLASQHIVMPNLLNNWAKYLIITTTGTLTLSAADGTTATTAAALNFSASNEISITADGTNLYLSINGIYQLTLANGGAGVSVPLLQLQAISSKTVSINEVTLWTSTLWTTGNHTPVTYVGTEAGLIARWPMATDATGIIGPALPR